MNRPPIFKSPPKIYDFEDANVHHPTGPSNHNENGKKPPVIPLKTSRSSNSNTGDFLSKDSHPPTLPPKHGSQKSKNNSKIGISESQHHLNTKTSNSDIFSQTYGHFPIVPHNTNKSQISNEDGLNISQNQVSPRSSSSDIFSKIDEVTPKLPAKINTPVLKLSSEIHLDPPELPQKVGKIINSRSCQNDENSHPTRDKPLSANHSVSSKTDASHDIMSKRCKSYISKYF